jgi:hypothetical protein
MADNSCSEKGSNSSPGPPSSGVAAAAACAAAAASCGMTLPPKLSPGSPPAKLSLDARGPQRGDPFFLELLLNDVALIGLLDATRSMEGVEFLHGGTRNLTSFRSALAEPSLRGCIEWASTCDLSDAREAIGVEQLAALRAWTCTPLCYAVCHVMRSPDRTLASVAELLPHPFRLESV